MVTSSTSIRKWDILLNWWVAQLLLLQHALYARWHCQCVSCLLDQKVSFDPSESMTLYNLCIIFTHFWNFCNFHKIIIVSSEQLQIGQTVVARVSSVDLERKRFALILDVSSLLYHFDICYYNPIFMFMKIPHYFLFAACSLNSFNE